MEPNMSIHLSINFPSKFIVPVSKATGHERGIDDGTFIFDADFDEAAQKFDGLLSTTSLDALLYSNDAIDSWTAESGITIEFIAKSPEEANLVTTCLTALGLSVLTISE